MICRLLLLLMLCTLASCFDVRFREDLYIAKDGSGRVVVNAEFDEAVQTRVRQKLDKYYKAACEVKGIGIDAFHIKAIGNGRSQLHFNLSYNNYRDLCELSDLLQGKKTGDDKDTSASGKKEKNFEGIFPGDVSYDFDGFGQVRVQRVIDPAVLVKMIEANRSMGAFFKNTKALDIQLDYYVHAPSLLSNNATNCDANSNTLHWHYNIDEQSRAQNHYFNVALWYVLPSWLRGLVYGAATGVLLAGLHVARRKWERSRRLANPKSLKS